MDLLAGLGAIFFLVLVAFLVKKKARDGISATAPEKNKQLFLLAGWLVAYNWVLAFANNRFGWDQGILATYFFVPTVVATTFKPRGKRWDGLVDLFLICWMWIPNDFGLKIIFSTWGGGALGYCLTVLTGMTYILILFTGWRNIDFKLDWSLTKRDCVWIVSAYFILAVLVIPPALAVGFIHPGIIKNPVKAALSPFIWFAPALVEELIFRGVIQRAMIKWLRPVAGIVASAIIFGFSHLDNKAGDYRYPNWRYVFFASIAGVVYGLVCHKRNLQSSVTVHFLVDFTWVILFRGGK